MDEEYGSIDWNAEYGNDTSVLDPFAPTMSDAINSTGAVSTPVTPKTSGLADLFHSLVVAPSGGVQTGSTVGNILNYFSQSLVQKPQSQPQAVTQQGLNNMLYGSGSTSKSMFSNPLVWIGILVAVVLAIIVIKKFA